MRAENNNTFEPGLPATGSFPGLPAFNTKKKVCVIGAGAFGGWTALQLVRRGYNVTLIDAWGAGNSRSSSGDETRVIRSTYGRNELYFKMNVRALELWKEHEKNFSRKIFFNTGVLWFCHSENTPIVDDSIPYAQKYGMDYEYLSLETLRKKYPEVNTNDLHHAYFDPFGGYLKAREACEEVKQTFIRQGGNFIQKHVRPGLIQSANLNEVVFPNGNRFNADVFIFACGAWLPFLFPEALQERIFCTRQEVFYFGVPEERAAAFDSMPAWIDADGSAFYYGIAGNALRGFKVGVDKRGDAFHPTSGERILNETVLAKARQFLANRFPGLKHAPLVENRVCAYENSIAGNFVFDLLPATENVFILGGGSGHGFKHGPALGEMVAGVISGEQKVPDLFRLN